MDPILATHIYTGGASLLFGLLAALFPKGGRAHILNGRLFAISMALSGLAGLVLSAQKEIHFLLGISFFTLYLVGSGWVFGFVRQMGSLKKYIRLLSIPGVLSAAYMFFVAFTGPAQGTIILSVFAGILTLFSASDMLGPIKPQTRIIRHGGRMGGAYIAAVTAFLVVNIKMEQMWILWLGPTVIGTIIITIALNRWQKRKAN